MSVGTPSKRRKPKSKAAKTRMDGGPLSARHNLVVNGSAVGHSLESARWTLPTQRKPKTPTSAFSTASHADDVAMRLLDHRDDDDSDLVDFKRSRAPLTQKDKKAIALLITLCAPGVFSLAQFTERNWFPIDLIQGVPVGLAMGSVPFLLKSRLSYSQLAIFSLA